MSPAALLLRADARALPLADASVQCVVTSPPYWGLRDYGVAGQLGLEKTPEEYVAHMVEVFREVRRVLRDDGTVWLNLGDSYSGGGGYSPEAPSNREGNDRNGGGRSRLFASDKRKPVAGLKPKDLVGIPWRVAFALQADGWWLRSDIVWSKPNPMPESITDRPTKAHEYVFLLTKRERYYYDAEAVKEQGTERPSGNTERVLGIERGNTGNGAHRGASIPYEPNGTGRNRRSVWTIATEPYPEAHFATFPEKLVEPCILAGTSERGCCVGCGAPWGRETEPSPEYAEKLARANDRGDWYSRAGTVEKRADGTKQGKLEGGIRPDYRTTGWASACDCPPRDPVPCRVLDPFAGSGTTVAVAERLGRVGIGVELKPDYLALGRKRTVQAGLL